MLFFFVFLVTVSPPVLPSSNADAVLLPHASASPPPLRASSTTGHCQSRPLPPTAASDIEGNELEMTEEELAVAEQEMEEDTATADRGAWARSWVCQDDLD